MNSINTAQLLFELRRDNKPLGDVPTELKELDSQDFKTAYEVQDLLVQRLKNLHNAKGIGYKIGCTSKGAQDLLNTDGPLFGQMLSSHHFTSPKVLDTSEYSMFVIEPEFGFQIAEDVPPTKDYDAQSIQAYIKSVMPSIEIVHQRFGSWDKFNAPITIADNAIHGCWVQGQALTDWQQLDYVNHGVKLFVDDELRTEGKAEIALGSPLNVLAWLANTLPKYGHALKQNDYVTTGVCMDVYTAKVGQKIVADFGSLGEVVIELS